jgi:beta-1,4-N-acetylglucosaminyltransferase
MTSSYKVGIICSSGGHLTQLHCLDTWWARQDRFWVCFDKPDARSRLQNERTYWGFFPTNRSILNLLRNGIQAIKILRSERPDILVSTGAGLAVPYFWIGKLFFGCKTIYIEVFDRFDTPSLSARLVRPVLDQMVIQREVQRSLYPDARLLGELL